MRLPYFLDLCKRFWGQFSPYVPYIVMLLVVACAYIFGVIDGRSHFAPTVTIDTAKERCVALEHYNPLQGAVVASKSGKTYYFPWCSGISRIKPENMRWFSTVLEAQKYGLKQAKNCT